MTVQNWVGDSCDWVVLRSVDTALDIHTWVYRYLLCRRTGKVWSSFETSVGGQGLIPSPPMGRIQEPFDLIPFPSRVYDLAPFSWPEGVP